MVVLWLLLAEGGWWVIMDEGGWRVIMGEGDGG